MAEKVLLGVGKKVFPIPFKLCEAGISIAADKGSAPLLFFPPIIFGSYYHGIRNRF